MQSEQNLERGYTMMGKIVVGFLVILAILLVVVATRPADFHIERSLSVAVPPDRVFPNVNDFHAWAAWSPWEKLDPQMQRTFSGPTAGPGASYDWRSTNGKVGEGHMTIQRSEPPSHIGIRLDFIKPMTATNAIDFRFVPEAAGTKVTWAMDGHHGFMGKAFSLVMSMDKLVGGDFERGLAALKSVSESATPKAISP
jgi:uncharacterized protein YndB with AHSA1/START domain